MNINILPSPSENYTVRWRICHLTAIWSFSGEAHVEFCCHLARGNIDPKEPPIYEYVKFVGDFKFHNNGKCFVFLPLVTSINQLCNIEK